MHFPARLENKGVQNVFLVCGGGKWAENGFATQRVYGVVVYGGV